MHQLTIVNFSVCNARQFTHGSDKKRRPGGKLPLAFLWAWRLILQPIPLVHDALHFFFRGHGVPFIEGRVSRTRACKALSDELRNEIDCAVARSERASRRPKLLIQTLSQARDVRRHRLNILFARDRVVEEIIVLQFLDVLPVPIEPLNVRPALLRHSPCIPPT